MNPLLGEIIMFCGNFAPVGWAICEGQILPIAQNPALFSVLGTTFGGNGTTTFALPDFRDKSTCARRDVYHCASGCLPQQKLRSF